MATGKDSLKWLRDIALRICEKAKCEGGEFLEEADKVIPYLKFLHPNLEALEIARVKQKDKASRSEAFNSALVECAESHGIPVDDNRLVIETSAALIAALEKAGVANAEEEVSRAIHRAMAREQWCRLARHLGDEVWDAQRQLFEYLRNDVSLGYSYLHPIETELEIFPDPDQVPGRKPLREPVFFRPTGPTAVDFDQGYVVRVDEVVGKALWALRDEKRGRYLLHGIAATGKSVIARDVAYRLHREGWQVRFLLGKKGFHDNKPAIMEEILRFGRSGGKTLVVFEDAHLHPGDSNQFLQVFDNPCAPRLMVTSRQAKLREFIQPYEKDNLAAFFSDEWTRHDLKPFAFASRIIELFCSRSNIPYSEDLDGKIKKETRGSLWVLAFALEALDEQGGRDFSRDQILGRVEETLENIARIGSGTDDPDYLFSQLLIAVSILYRREVPTEIKYLQHVFKDRRNDVAKSINKLVRLGEVVRTRYNNNIYYSLPHSSLADLYYEHRANSELSCANCEESSRYIAEYIHFGAGNWPCTRWLIDRDVLSNLDHEIIADRLLDRADMEAKFFLDTLGWTDKDAAWEIVAKMDPEEVGRRLQEHADGWAGFFLNSLWVANEEAAWKVVTEMDPAEAARRLQERADCNAGRFLDSFRGMDKKAARKIVAEMDPAEAARRLQERADWDAGRFLDFLRVADKEAARKVIAEMDPVKVARQLQKRTEEEARLFLDFLRKANKEAARKIEEEMLILRKAS